MTTAAERKHASKRCRRGQSLVEFALMVPLIVTLLVTMREVNMAINAAIVNQRYARATMHFLFFNHRWYPEQFLIDRKNGEFMRRWWVGVGQEKAANADESPVAPTIKIGRAKGSEEQGIEITSRQNVRIRANAFVCLPPRGIRFAQPFSEGFMPDTAFLPGSVFPYCNDPK